MYMMSAAWASFAIVLSVLGAAYTWFAWKSRGWRGLTRGAAITMLPIAAWLTGTLRLFAVVVDWFAGWATGLVFSPSIILGTVLAVVSVALFSLSARLGGGTRRPQKVRRGAGEAKAVPVSRPARGQVDDELADIEAMLRKRGIS